MDSAAMNEDVTLDCQVELIKETVSFLSQYKGIYDFKMTTFFCERAWGNIPIEVSIHIYSNNNVFVLQSYKLHLFVLCNIHYT